MIDLPDVPCGQVVASSAIDPGDGTWMVSAYGPQGTNEVVRSRGLVVQPVKSADQVDAERSLCSGQRLPGFGGHHRPAAALAAAHPDICQAEVLPQRTHEGLEVLSVLITAGADAGADPARQASRDV